MARNTAVWGIDIGQCALKALRLRAGDDPQFVVADAFDFIEYPKILSQPEANPEELIRDALTQFLSRNSVRGDQVAISVPGQAGLARFIKLPPVESKKIPDIVKYEARQQIPFALEDVVWDYQQMPGGNEEDGFALETEVGLFAMKREQVAKAMAPFDKAAIEIDFVQLAPLALYNFVAFDQLIDLPEQFDADSPPESIVVLSLGTDTTDLVVTNGFRVWQRSIPLGGSHFTRALTKEMKLTFAKAEHLKRNAAAAEDPRAVFQAMRPVFNDMVTEIQRSLSYFTNIDRSAKISKIIGLGNAMKLPGLQRFLTQQLGLEVIRLDTFRGLKGDAAVNAPAFKENLLSFAPSYGLALQGLRDTKIHTNLIPGEIVKERLIRRKKPWAIAAAALLLVGLSTRTVRDWQALRTADKPDFAPAMSQADQIKRESQQLQGDYTGELQKMGETGTIGFNLIKDLEQRDLWLEMLASVNACIPNKPEDPADAKEPLAKRIANRDRIYLTRLDPVLQSDMTSWLSVTAPMRNESAEALQGGGAGEQGGEGFVVLLEGYHYHNLEADHAQAQYIRETLIKNLKEHKLTLTDAAGNEKTYEVKRLGINAPTLVSTGDTSEEMVNPEYVGVSSGAKGVPSDQSKFKVQRTDFVVEFAWKPTPRSLRTDPEPAADPNAPTDPNAPVDPNAPPGGIPGATPMGAAAPATAAATGGS